jgi:Na+/melibiose symporter-like transporter
MQTVSADLSRKDLLRAQFQVVRRLRVFKMLFVAMVLVATYLTMNSFPQPGALGVFSAFVVAALITICAILITYLVAAVRLLVKLPAAKGALGAHQFALDDDGLRELTDSNEMRVAWGHAKQVFRTRTFVFVLVRKPTILLIPRRAFADRRADAQFWNALQPLVAQKEK